MLADKQNGHVRPDTNTDCAHVSSFREGEIGYVVSKKDGSRATVSVIGDNGPKKIFFGDKQRATCRKSDDPLHIVRRIAQSSGHKFYQKGSAERKQPTRKTIKRKHGKGAHLMHRIHSGYEF